MAKAYQQEPVAVVGFACRLPGGNHSPQKLWDFLEQGKIAPTAVPETRFNIQGHYDGSHKPGTMRPPGGMFLGDVDLADFDAAFFEISGTEAIAMDPNQRQMLEVVYEGLENAGIPLQKLDGAPVACFVGSYSSDYGDMQNRDAEDRPPNCAVGVGRTIMANRLSYFLNIKGPSITIDTACSASLTGVDLACRSLHTGEVNAAIVATSNFYLNPDHVMDSGIVGQTHSPTALCHTFDEDADGYVKAEAVSCVILKRLTDAIQDRDPIRGVIRGTASNSNGRTGGIASPSAEAQAAAIRRAYANAGIVDFNETAYLECHGTGTQAGDPIEVRGIASVFSATRPANKPLLIGSVKSNVGHSEPAAGISGMMKAIMSMERGLIPGNPTFIKPSPKIDFIGSKVKPSRTATPWPDEGFPVRRASVNAFGYGGSNAHAIIEQPRIAARSAHTSSYKVDDDDDYDDLDIGSESERPHTLVVSANDAASLKANIEALCNHLVNPRVHVDLADLAYTLSERRTGLWHRAFITTHSTQIEASDFVVGKRSAQLPRVSFIFTGQGAQWPQMGRDLVKYFPWTRAILAELDQVLQAQPSPPKWSLLTELTEARTAEHLRQPEFSQPLVTALQLCIVAVLQSWGIKPGSVVGHSSGEIAAAYTAGFLDRAGAIKAAFYRGRAAVNRQADVDADVGMLAVGLSAQDASPFLDKYAGNVWIACFNSPSALTISGKKPALEALAADVKAAGHFARLLMVDLAYHSELMSAVGEEYHQLLSADADFRPTFKPSAADVAIMYSSVTAGKKDTPADALYWKTNMVSPVRFAEALQELVTQDYPDLLIEIGPSGALAGPVSQVLKSLPHGADVSYCASWSRGSNAGKALFDVAGRLFVNGGLVDLSVVNGYDTAKVRTIIDLPNYSWNHSIQYWYENEASKNWRFKQFVTHDLLGAKIPSTTWEAPTWRKHLDLADVPWLGDHRAGPDVVIPGAGLCTFALEAMYQKHCALNPDEAVNSPNELAFRFRNVNFKRALVVDDHKTTTILLTLSKAPGSKDWHEWRIRTKSAGVTIEHCYGLIRVVDPVGDEGDISGADLEPLKHPQNPKLWYKLQDEVGMSFGPAFQKLKAIESVSGSRKCRTIMSLEPPPSKWNPQSYYPIHPAVFDTFIQTVTPANAAGDRSSLKDVMIPALIDDIIVNKMPKDLHEGLSLAESVYTGRGRKDVAKSWIANIGIHDPQSGALLVRITGLNYVRLDVEAKPDPHVFQTVVWKPDVSLLTQNQLDYLGDPSAAAQQQQPTKLDTVIDLVAHRRPTLKVLEVDLDGRSTASLWFNQSGGASGDATTARAAFSRYVFATVDANNLVKVQMAYESKKDSEFHLLSLSNDDDLLSELRASEPTYDLVIVRSPGPGREEGITVEEVTSKLKPLLKHDAFTLVVPYGVQEEAPLETETDDGGANSDPNSPQQRSSSPSTASLSDSTSNQDGQTPPSSVSLTPFELKPAEDNSRLKTDGVFDSVRSVATRLGSGQAYLYTNNSTSAVTANAAPRHVTVAWFSQLVPPALDPSLQSALESSGWTVTNTPIEQLATTTSSSKSSLVLIVQELSHRGVLTRISSPNWSALKQVIGTGRPILWVTQGAQTTVQVTHPDNAMVQGLFRVIRHEDPVAKLATLDVQSAGTPAASWAIEQVLGRVFFRLLGLDAAAAAETEYAERDGILYIPRVMPDGHINEFRAAAEGSGNGGFEPVTQGLHAAKPQVRLQAEKIGTLQSLTWTETAVDEVPTVAPGMVEIEVMAVGVNFKDVATTMGIVPENEHTIGCECAGYVKRVAPDVAARFSIGDRVVCMSHGTYVNRLQCPADRVHVIPDGMSYEDAATIPLVYLTAIYSLYHLASLREGQSVLIHSAAGGVGIAAIQLAQHKKCDIFVTVGTDDKREFLANNFGIPQNRIFNSRNTKFAEHIRRETKGRGVDVILNSLIGDLLDESWRLTADGGIMVEIGKRDIVDRNTLAMEPFDRNCSFRAVDLSYTREITDQLIGGLLSEIFTLVRAGHIGPIHPVIVYPFDKVIDALTLIRRGQHMGKIVISSGTKVDPQLPVRPAIPKLQLRPKASYLVVGGLKGLCGSVAIHLARHGARHIIVMSRSGTGDEASARVIAHCAGHGCTVTSARGDVGDSAFVSGVFDAAARASRPIAGVIQGAMVLRDKPYETMTHDDYHAAIHAKVAGTWNLHNASSVRSPDPPPPLDFFTLLSSISGVVGNKGQANYAAANTFLDAFASYRRGLGLRANTVDLGAVQDVGYIAEQGEAGASSLEARFDRQQQWTPINEGTLRRILDLSLFQQRDEPLNRASASQLITGIAYPLAQGGASELSSDPRFGYLFSTRGGPNGGGGNEKESVDGSSDATAADQQAIKAFRLMRSSGADSNTLIKSAIELLKRQVTKLLRLETEIEPGKPLMAYGLDSLSAVELRGWVRQNLESELSTLDINNASSLVALCEKLVVKLVPLTTS